MVQQLGVLPLLDLAQALATGRVQQADGNGVLRIDLACLAAAVAAAGAGE